MTVNLILISGSYSTGSAWRPVCEYLPKDWTVKTVTLPGYGGQPDPRTTEDVDMTHIAAPVIEAARELGGKVHLGAHSFGGQAAVSAILDCGLTPLSLTTFESNLVFPLKQSGQDDLFAEILNIRDRFTAAFHANDGDAAKLIIDYWGGQGSWDLMPPQVQDFAREGTWTNLLDWKAACQYQPDLTHISKGTYPVSLQRGAFAVPSMHALTLAAADMIPRATVGVIDGANHFLIATHPEECAAALVANVERA